MPARDKTHLDRLLRMRLEDQRRIVGLDSRLRVVEADLANVTKTLLVIWGDGTSDPAGTAKEGLAGLSAQIECPYCEGTQTVFCGKCHGGGTREYPCPTCGNSGEVTCEDCEGKGAI